MGQSSFTAESMQKSLFLQYYFLITALFSIQTIVDVFCPTLYFLSPLSCIQNHKTISYSLKLQLSIIQGFFSKYIQVHVKTEKWEGKKTTRNCCASLSWIVKYLQIKGKANYIKFSLKNELNKDHNILGYPNIGHKWSQSKQLKSSDECKIW